MIGHTVWLVIFCGYKFRETGQTSGFRNFSVLIFTVGESRIHGLGQIETWFTCFSHGQKKFCGFNSRKWLWTHENVEINPSWKLSTIRYNFYILDLDTRTATPNYHHHSNINKLVLTCWNLVTVSVTNLHRAFGISSNDLGSIGGEVAAEDSTGVSQGGLARWGIHIPELQREGFNWHTTVHTRLLPSCFIWFVKLLAV